MKPPIGAVIITTDRIVGAVWTAGGSVIATPIEDVAVQSPVDGTITSVTVMGDDSNGSCVIDIWKKSTYPPTVADTITASDKPTISANRLKVDTILTGWDTDVSEGDYLVFHLDSTGTFKRITIQLTIETTD
jgi:hypothetical protein